ncbi:transporter substrate-binding domain-containing protein [Halomonas eurihalina]|uniref:Transporter substrate-binding domain-containing protein n=1 Tax=Halomonas eurihalina TaxID=42566 RepID=A0A5D9D7W5_HALER|nr:transporter substrate-binding domain-containing protein [Halomonas eurihalina]MDR5860002.1 transporter substrate-binding domain-containing protein [Halomonas eurihalina]TZG39817.1 transporter substrate-binding domain-containing protein [Halomonas eurihalina]
MKKHLAFTFLSAAIIAGTAHARDDGSVRIAIDVPYEPFVVRAPDGELEGFEIDLGNELCHRADLECTWVEQGWDGIIPGLLARKYDAIISSMGVTPERERQVLFSIPYYNTPSVWITRRDRDIDIDDRDSLEGLSVGVQRGTIRDDYVTQQYRDVLDIRRYSSSQEVANDLMTGRLDLSFEDYPLADETFDFTSDDSEFKQIGDSIKEPTSIFGKGAAIAFHKRDGELAEKFNEALREVYADGTFDELMHEYFDYDLSLPIAIEQ